MLSPMLSSVPLSAKSAAIEAEVLAIPFTVDAIEDPLPPGLDADDVERFHHGAIHREKWIIPELKKAIRMFPGVPALKNFLQIAYLGNDQERQARAIQEEILASHPDYLFGKIAVATDYLQAGKPEQARAVLGGDLDLAKLYPDRDLFHVSEVKNFYASVAVIHFQAGEMEKGLGVQSALEKLVPGDPVLRFVEVSMIHANAKRWHEMLAEDEKLEIKVKCTPLSKALAAPNFLEFHHPVIDDLYEYDLDLPDGTIREILSLPRETLVADLIAVLRDGILHTPDFLKSEDEDESSFFPFHAIHLLGELAATEALPAVLELLSLPAEAISFWLGDYSHSAQIAAICASDLPRVSAWLKLPGISSAGKGAMSSALTYLALSQPDTREEVIGIFGSTLEVMLTSQPSDNVLDTPTITFIVGDLMDLRAVELRPLIERLWKKRYILRSIVGDLEAILGEIESPLETGKSKSADHSMIARYHAFRNRGKETPQVSSSDIFGLSDREHGLPAPAEPPRVDVGRNDPCPCGSGKKYKKCCIGK